MIDIQPLEVKEFHGGITDNYIDNFLHKKRELNSLFILVEELCI